MTRRALLLVAALVIVFAVPASAGAAKRPRFTVVLPTPGHVTIAALDVTLKVDKPRRLARHVRIGFGRGKPLPPSVKVLTAQRFTRTRHGGKYAVLAIVVNRAGAASARMADRRPTFLDLLFEGRNEGPCKNCHAFEYEDTLDSYGGLCPECVVKARRAKEEAERDADAKDVAEIERLIKQVESDFNQARDLDTGHYDDGHSFGWGIKTKPEIIKVEHSVIDDLIQNEQQNMVKDVEVAANVDLDGDGKIGGGGENNTTLGPPTIT